MHSAAGRFTANVELVPLQECGTTIQPLNETQRRQDRKDGFVDVCAGLSGFRAVAEPSARTSAALPEPF